MRKDGPEIDRLARCIDLIARRCWHGLPALLGKAPQPSRDQLKQAFYYRPSSDDLGVKVQGGGSGDGRDISQADSFIDDYDPVFDNVSWADIVEGVKWYSQAHAPEWQMYVTFVSYKETGRAQWNGEGTAEKLARKFDLTPASVYDIVRKTPRRLAWAISLKCYELALINF